MAEDNALKSSVELAMERLRKKDVDAGIESRQVTDQQKAAIAEIRSFYDAKIAEQDVLHQSKLRASLNPEERETISQEFRRERERLSGERDRKIDKAREE
jgi:dephospho-CoA kinase